MIYLYQFSTSHCERHIYSKLFDIVVTISMVLDHLVKNLKPIKYS